MTKYDVACLFHIEPAQSTFPYSDLQSSSKKVGKLKRRLKMLINAKYILVLPNFNIDFENESRKSKN